MGNACKWLRLLLVIVLSVPTVTLALAESASAQATGDFTYQLPDCTVKYSIIKIPPQGPSAVNPCAYNIIVYGPLPYEIRVTFIDNGSQETDIVPIAQSSSLACDAYPTDIIMTPLVPSITNLLPAYTTQIPKPSTPQFTLGYDKASYSVIDPYTGESKQIDNSTVSVSIKNQPFNQIYEARDNMTTSMYYNVEFKGHFTENWTDPFTCVDTGSYSQFNLPIQSNSTYTTIQLPTSYPTNSQIDVRVQAVIVNQTVTYVPNSFMAPLRPMEYHLVSFMSLVQVSDWSNPQTVTFGETSASTQNPTSSPNTTPPVTTPIITSITTPSQNTYSNLLSGNQQFTIIALVVAVAVLGLAVVSLLVYVKKIKNTNQISKR
jgi:hypothetical protein